MNDQYSMEIITKLVSAKDIITEYFEKCDKETNNIKDLRRLLAHIKNTGYENIFFHEEEIMFNKIELQQFIEMFKRYKLHEPISKIINHKNFWTHDFFVNSDVLDPRPETEIIIEMFIKKFDKNSPMRILDLGTGSGCILLSLLSEFPKAYGIGIDFSSEAINVAQINQNNLNITNATFLTINWNDFAKNLTYFESIDCIVSNPPYIKTDNIATLNANVRKYDPVSALDGGKSGLNAYHEIIKLSASILKKGYIFLEVDCNQAVTVTQILKQNHFIINEVQKDLSNIDRIICAEKINGCRSLREV